MDEFIRQLFLHWGPSAIPWIISATLGYLLWKNRNNNPYEEHLKVYKELADAYHEAIIENSRITERLAVLIEERTRIHNDGYQRH